ncbi:MAG: GNAT family N-acetyltransferase [Bacteroidales bacterium]
MENTEFLISNQAGTFRIRPICPDDSRAIRDIILETLIEHGAVGGGFASGDQDTQQMYEAFQKEGRRYFVIEWEGSEALPYEALNVMGGAGIAPLPGEPGTCELVKMYFRPEARGLGLGKRLLQLCLEEAVKIGYTQIYLETIEPMHAARGLYEHLGFKQIPDPMGNTGHFSCDVFYLMELV